MQIKVVKSNREKKRFIKLPVRLYKGKTNWIRPIDKEVEAIFDPQENKSFEHGSCERWLLTDKGMDIGRIAAFVIRKEEDEEVKIAGGIGFLNV